MTATIYSTAEIYTWLDEQHAHDTWTFPDGPYGWKENGTSAAPTSLERQAHVCWYHDIAEGLEDVTCAWFALCGRPATRTRQHPTLGLVALCEHCHAKIEALS